MSVFSVPATHLGERVTVDYVVRPAIHGDVHASIQVLPVVMLPTVILGHAMASDKFALRDTRVLHNRLYDTYAVVFQVVIDTHLANTVMLFCRERNIFLEIGIELQNLLFGTTSRRERERNNLNIIISPNSLFVMCFDSAKLLDCNL